MGSTHTGHTDAAAPLKIGVSVAVPEPWGSQLQDYRVQLGDTVAVGIPTHITLLPPTEVDVEDLSEIDAHLGEVAARTQPFQVHLRGTGTFRPVSAVVFVAVAHGISSLERLSDAIRRPPLDGVRQFPYHPHVTVAHDLDETSLDRAYDELAGFECRFTATKFHLYCHHDGSGWVPTRSFDLG